MNWTISVILICVLLAIFTIWIEYRRDNRSRLAWRILASIIAIVALACIALPITYLTETKTTGDNDAVLLTENYSADSISHAGYKMIFTTDKAIKKAYPKATLLSNIQDINNIHPAIKQLHILGYGLDEYELQQLNHIPVIYNAPSIPAGISAINWPGQLKAGELLQVQGSYNNTLSQPVKLLLKGLNTSMDSVNIPAGKSTSFELATLPKVTGRVAYTFLALNGKDTLEKGSVPVTIEAAKPIKILLLSASPDFETKFLKNWLGQNGYVVASRAAISKDKTSQDFVNMEKEQLDHLSAALLNKFDVVVGDLSTLKSLSPAENAALKQQVDQNGLGIVIRADSSGKATSWLQNDFGVNTVSAKTAAVPLLLQGQKNKTAPLSVDPTYIADRNNIQNLVFDNQNHILAATTLSGQGKLVFTTLRNTYTWMLAGSNNDYSALWSLLINKAARKLPPAANWAVTSPIAGVNEPVTAQLQSSATPVQITIDHAVVSPVQNALTAYEWNYNYWPQIAGWHQINSNEKNSFWWYAYPKNNWNMLRNSKKIADTKKYSDNRNAITTVTKQIHQKVPIEVSKMYFYLLLLACITFLWVEKKLLA
ncbi:MAG TPA: hypothetical protein VGC01_02265 [Mucilaginibacter sp.]